MEWSSNVNGDDQRHTYVYGMFVRSEWMIIMAAIKLNTKLNGLENYCK